MTKTTCGRQASLIRVHPPLIQIWNLPSPTLLLSERSLAFHSLIGVRVGPYLSQVWLALQLMPVLARTSCLLEMTSLRLPSPAYCLTFATFVLATATLVLTVLVSPTVRTDTTFVMFVAVMVNHAWIAAESPTVRQDTTFVTFVTATV